MAIIAMAPKKATNIVKSRDRILQSGLSIEVEGIKEALCNNNASICAEY